MPSISALTTALTLDDERLAIPRSYRLTAGTYTLNSDGTITLNGTLSPAAPGGPNLAVQINNAGVFGGEAAFAYNPATNILTVDSIIATGGILQLAPNVAGTDLRVQEGDLAFQSNPAFQSTFIRAESDNVADDSVCAVAVQFQTGGMYAEMELYNNLTAPVLVNGAVAGPQITYGGTAPIYFSPDGFVTAVFSMRTTEVQSFVPSRLPTYTVATLPGSPQAGWKAFVSNALAPAFGAVVAGGGAVFVPVYYDGAAWRVG